MEFTGRIQNVLPVRSGTSSKGEWNVLPFIFEYYETQEQRWSDRVILETMDHDIMRTIGQFVMRDPQTKKGIEENGVMKLTGEIKCRVGFSHSVREYEGKHFNQLRCYKFELVTDKQQPVGAPGEVILPSQINNFAPQPQPSAQEDDGLPF